MRSLALLFAVLLVLSPKAWAWDRGQVEIFAVRTGLAISKFHLDAKQLDAHLKGSVEAQLLADAAGTPVPIDPEQAERTASFVGAPMAGWRAFQPLYDWIVEQQPDLLEE